MPPLLFLVGEVVLWALTTLEAERGDGVAEEGGPAAKGLIGTVYRKQRVRERSFE